MIKLFNLRPGQRALIDGSEVVRVHSNLFAAPRGNQRKSKPVLAIDIETGKSITENYECEIETIRSPFTNFQTTVTQ